VRLLTFINFVAWTKRKELLQGTEIGRDGFDLRLGQAMRDWLHDGDVSGFIRILTPLFAPIRQFPYDVGIELTC